MIEFDGRVAIVTGAGGGLGRTYALELARRGAAVVVNDLGGARDGAGADTTAADRVVAEIREAGGRAIADHGSVTDPEAGQAMVDRAVSEFGGVDILINNAGILRDRSAAKLTPGDVDAVLDVHLRGAFNVTLPAYRVMKAAGYGRIVFTSSIAGLLGNFGQANYGAAKMGLVGLANVISVEGERYGVLANSIAPIALTRMTEDLIGPGREMLAPEWVTPLVTYLVSERCEVTREIFSVGGGRYARMFVGVTPGWFTPGSVPSAEDVWEHLADIRDIDDFSLLRSAPEESALLASMMQAHLAPSEQGDLSNA
ncbi:SDR family NAD(P)-dependent oxidoreductase [Streptosporangium sp. NPDC006013]|uniref:SDR family NAD(P)-dependent oxidoreductase n=1 Tax=Streptosporangium sp. NPDC006013 TaxID=3155596 RepID=UPI00339E3D95